MAFAIIDKSQRQPAMAHPAAPHRQAGFLRNDAVKKVVGSVTWGTCSRTRRHYSSVR